MLPWEETSMAAVFICATDDALPVVVVVPPSPAAAADMGPISIVVLFLKISQRLTVGQAPMWRTAIPDCLFSEMMHSIISGAVKDWWWPREKGEARFSSLPRDDATENGEEKPARIVSAAAVVDAEPDDFFFLLDVVLLLEDVADDVTPPPET